MPVTNEPATRVPNVATASAPPVVSAVLLLSTAAAFAVFRRRAR